MVCLKSFIMLIIMHETFNNLKTIMIFHQSKVMIFYKMSCFRIFMKAFNVPYKIYWGCSCILGIFRATKCIQPTSHPTTIIGKRRYLKFYMQVQYPCKYLCIEFGKKSVIINYEAFLCIALNVKIFPNGNGIFQK